MTLKDFEEYIKSGVVKKQSPNIQRSISLLKEAENKKKFLDLSIRTIPKDKMSGNFIVDSCYDIIMEIIRSIMFRKGLNAGNSHEAEVAYLKILGITQGDIRFIDELRYNRNGIKYYGVIFDMEYANQVLSIVKRILLILRPLSLE